MWSVPVHPRIGTSLHGVSGQSTTVSFNLSLGPEDRGGSSLFVEGSDVPRKFLVDQSDLKMGIESQYSGGRETITSEFPLTSWS